MKHLVLLAGAVLTIVGITPAAAAPATAPFGCDARVPAVCHFRIHYGPRHSRAVTLPAGVNTKIPGVEIGRDRYCVAINQPPAGKCTRKIVNANYNN